MTHPGLSNSWALVVLFAMLGITVWSLSKPNKASAATSNATTLAALPAIGPWLQWCVTRPGVLLALRILMVAIFLLVIVAGLFGTPIPERNLATTLTWTLWWTGLIIAVYFTGSAWCAMCPWDALAMWLVRWRLWRRGSATSSLNLRIPKALRNVWPALGMFVGLTWLELGVGITTSPYATALLALFVLVLAIFFLALYERKAFCRYVCSVGRTVGVYSQLSPIALRPIDPDICANCKTLECYQGTEDIEPCPTYLVLGSLKENTYCTSCGACSQSCPDQNVNWSLRPTGDEAIYASRPHWDGAWFILGLVTLTSFHGITMLPSWEEWTRQLAYMIGDSGQLLMSFSTGMLLGMLIPIVVFMLLVRLTQLLMNNTLEFKRLFSVLTLTLLPLAFSYHIAHNLNHLVRESKGFVSVLFNPLGIGTQPLSSAEKQLMHMQPLLTQDIIFALQALLIVFGFWLAVRILSQRMQQLPVQAQYVSFTMLPVLSFIIAVSLFNLWLLMQPMNMRM